MIGAVLRCRVRRVRLVRTVFGEQPRGSQAAVDLVCRYVQQAKPVALRGRVFAHDLQQLIRANDVRLDERTRSVDRTIDVRLRSEMNDRIRSKVQNCSAQSDDVADVDLSEV